ncbi:MAG: efflux RND transporter permease subunit [Rhodospirillales bacterium]|nr:efflux RND transporter permease subunit [Rhodospirillales bacterium]
MIRYFTGHATAANMLMLAIIMLGLVALPKLQRDTFPVIPATEVEVRANYPGATPSEVEDAICQRIEDALDSVMNLAEVRCDARENVAIATAQMVEGADMTEFFDDVKSQVEAITAFPDKVEKPSVTKLQRTANVASIAITAAMTPEGLKAYAEKVKDRLKRDPSIAQVRIQGFSDQDVFIELPEAVLRRYGLSVTDVQAAITRQNIDMPAGTLQTHDGDMIVRFNEQRSAPEEFANLVVVSGKTGGRIRLGDITEIQTRFDRPEDKVFFNGSRAALLDVSKTYDQDSLRVMEAIKKNLVREQSIAPRGMKMEISSDVTSNISDRLRILLSNGLQGLGLVFLTMWLFFSLRFSFWVTMGLPVSFLGTVYAMNALGYSLNMMTMVGLLVAIGLLMDDAIVISENVASHRRRGKSALQAAVDGVRQVMPGVISSFLTTVMIVGPLAFLSGKMGAVLKYLPAVLLITLIVSLVEAFFILPAHLSHSMKDMNKEKRKGLQAWFDGKFERLRDAFFVPQVARAVRQPYLALGAMMALAMVSYATIPAGLLKYQAFPTLESDVIQARVLLPQGTPLERTEGAVEQMINALKQLDEEFSARQSGGRRMVKNISVLYNTNVDAYESGPHLATVSADLLRAEERDGTVDEMLTRWRELVGDLPDVVALKFTDKERGVAGKAIDLRLQGNNLTLLKKASLDLQEFLAKFKGVKDVSDDLRPGKPELRITIKDSAGVFGMTATAIAGEVRAALHGGTNMEVLTSNETYDVTIRIAADDRNSIDDVRYLKIKAPDGSLIPLSAVAEIEQTRGYARIHRVNGSRTVTVQGAIDTNVVNARELMGMVKKFFAPELKKNHPGIRMASQGQDKDTSDTGNSLQTNILIGVVGIFIILTFQFRSYIQPLSVMLAIPMGLIGVVWGHVAMGLDLTMPSLVGFATLAGIVVNDNILLVTFVKDRLREGVNVIEATQEAARDRFRPIMITSLTTLAGLLPLLMETSTQAQLLIPLVASIAFGLLTATVSSLFIVPVFFTILDDLGWLKIVAEKSERGRSEMAG